MSSRLRQYLRINWGAPFVLAFIILLIASAGYLSYGNSNTANEIAIYAFYSLVLGVGLQIASYIKFGEENKEEPEYVPSARDYKRIRLPRRSILAIIVIIIIIISSGVGVFYYREGSSKITTMTNSTSAQTTAGLLKIGISFLAELPEPRNAIEILLGINQTGGLYPFNYTAYWSDGVTQTNVVGVFVRSFLSNQSVPYSARVVVMSSDAQNATLVTRIPPVNRSTTATSSTTSIIPLPTITFAETGLPSGSLWSISLSGSGIHSSTSEIVFNYPKNAILNYTISGPYDSKNFNWALVPVPRTGSFIVNGATSVSIAFANESVITPQNQLLSLVSSPVMSSTGPSSEQIQVTFHNAFPAQIQAIIFGTVTNNRTGAVSMSTSTINPEAFSNETVSLMFSGLTSGTYTTSLFAESSNGVILSMTTNSTFTLP